MTGRPRLFVVTVFILSLVWAVVPMARAAERDSGAPPELAAWEDWVLFDQEERACPTLYNSGDGYRCLWPSRLDLTIEPAGGHFTQKWLVFAPAWAPLPGGPGQWPEAVEVDGRQTPIVDVGGRPSIRVEPGDHTVTGVFVWDEIPETIRTPEASGLIRLTLSGRFVDFPVWDKGGRLWLQKRVEPKGEADRLEVRVMRLVSDAIPMRVTSRLIIDVSGRAREVNLEGTLLQGAVPMRLRSKLPARIDLEGNLKFQARPGRWEIEILSRLEGPVKEIGPIPGRFGQEVWAFQAQNHLRMVKVTGPSPVDPGQTDLPDRWKEHPAYLMDPEARMGFEEIKRGDPEPAPDRLALDRTLWLDFDGRGFTVQDRIAGTMSRQWYLAVNKPGILGRVMIDNEAQLITDQGGLSGVELRRGNLNMTADSRLDGPLRRVPAVGWDHDFQSVIARLNLPPGWRLVTATGVDVVPGTWFERWTLLDLFLVLIIAMAVFKLFGWRWGLLALVTMVLIYHEPDSPRIVWLNLLAALALLKVLPDGWAKRIAGLWRLASVITLVILAVPFIIGQVRVGVFPQLERPGVVRPATTGRADQKRETGLYEEDKGGFPSIQPTAPPPPLETERKPQAKVKQRKKAKEDFGLYDQNVRQQAVLTQDPNAQIQTGPGLPRWSWRSIEMKWNGPVKRDQEVRLYLLSPEVNLVLCFLRVILLTVMVVGLIGLRRWWRDLDKAPVVTAAAVVMFILPGSAWAAQPEMQQNQMNQNVQVQQMVPNQAPNAPFAPAPVMEGGGIYPPARLLDELRERLLEPPDCLPYCAAFPRLDLSIDEQAVRMTIEIHALAESAVPLPGSADSWLPESVMMGEGPAVGLRRDKDGTLWMLAPEGIHRIVLLGKPAPGNTFEIPMPLKPARVSVTSDGWEIRGLEPGGRVQASLQFTRLKKEGDKQEDLRGSVLPPYLHVERTLFLGLTWRVLTRVRRLTPAGSPIVLAVPLLPGESVTTAGIRVEKGQAQINMGPRDRELTWSSALETAPKIVLAAPKNAPWTETWILDASPVWHCDLSGIPVIHHQDGRGQWRPTWQPWPGESVTVNVTRPRAVPGQTLTIESARLEWTPGRRFNKAGLTIGLRASQGGQHTITLPEGAELQVVKINNRTQPIGQDGRKVVAPLKPGQQRIFLEWHEKAGRAWAMRSPEVRIGGPAVNADVVFHLPRSRWILWVGGPRLGPAVLFWSYVVAVILASLALGRIRWTPLKTRHWLLLGLGLTQVPTLVAIVIVGWLLILGVREKNPPGKNWFVFDLAQLGLAVWTAVALIFMYWAVHRGLLGIPDMQIDGNGSSAFQLNWTQDRIGDMMPRPWVLSLPKLAFNGLMLAWAVWLALSLMRWLRWGWQSFNQGGLWKMPAKRDKKEKTAPAAPPDLPEDDGKPEAKKGEPEDFLIE